MGELGDFSLIMSADIWPGSPSAIASCLQSRLILADMVQGIEGAVLRAL